MSTARQHNRIDLLTKGRYEEYRAAAAIRPGVCLKVDANGEVSPHDTASTNYDLIVALHDQKNGKTVDDAYAVGDLVPVLIPYDGDVLAVMLESAQDTTLDDFLTCTSTGTFQVASSTNKRLLRVLEIKTGTGSADRLVKARVVRG